MEKYFCSVGVTQNRKVIFLWLMNVSFKFETCWPLTTCIVILCYYPDICIVFVDLIVPYFIVVMCNLQSVNVI